MIILGLATYHNSSAASLLINGELVACFEEEKLRGIKNQWLFPSLAIMECLGYAGKRIGDVDLIAVNHDPGKCFSWEYLRYAQDLRLFKTLMFRVLYYRTFYRKVKQDLGAMFPGLMDMIWPRVCFYEHHVCHAASAYFFSPFARAAILTADGSGESSTGLYARGEGTHIAKINEMRYPASLGKFYTAVTEHLGYRPYAGEGTVMALAAYGDRTPEGLFDRIVQVRSNGRLYVNTRYFNYWHPKQRRCSARFDAAFGQPRQPGGVLTACHKNMAAAVQGALENNIIRMLEYLKRESGCDHLCLAGGVFLNCALNAVVRKTGLFKDIYVQPAMNDVGTSFGAAYLCHYQHTNHASQRGAFPGPYLGRSFNDAEIKDALEKSGLNYQYCADPALVAAQLLASGKVVAWFQGRAEIGPRALGNRSILASPVDAKIRDRINAQIKHREWFRPFAPAVLEEKAGEYFVGQSQSPFMLYTSDVVEAKKREIPACVHHDGTARHQTVSIKDNPLFYRLIMEFYRITGVPLVLNTSLNLRGQPIVNSPQEAIAIIKRSTMDVLIIGPYVVERA